jgi:hypothetical protein
MLLRKDFTNLHFGRAVVTDSPSQAVVIVQTEHFRASENLDGHTKGKNYIGYLLLTFLLRKKKKKKKVCPKIDSSSVSE